MTAKKPRLRLSPAWLLASCALLLLALVPRLIRLEARPLMHDESLFAFYAYVFMDRGTYTHFPLLHGPALMLSVGTLFVIFGDSIGVARGFIAACSLVAMAASLGLAPRRYRWWLALLWVTSPILLYYSRFLRNEMLFNAVLMLGLLGISYGLSGGRLAVAAMALGVAAVVTLLAIMENALFVQAAGVMFIVVWTVHRAVSRREWGGRRHAPAPPTPGGLASRPAGRRRGALVVGSLAGLLAGSLFVGYLYGVTLGPWYHRQAVSAVTGAPPERISGIWAGKERLPWWQDVGVAGWLVSRSWINMKASWGYWEGQHTEHRIRGDLHYHLPILLTYELPAILLLLAGLGWDAFARRRRLALYGAACLTWVLVWLMWRTIPTVPAWMARIQAFLHLDANASTLTLGLIITPILVWAVLSLRRRHPLAAWTGWWTACSFFQYSVAGEKVPWLAVHIVVPMYLMLAWLWAPRLRRLGARGHAIALGVIVIAAVVGLRNDVPLIGARAADARERLVYNHTTPWFQDTVTRHLALWQAPSQPVPFHRRKVVLAGGPQWPALWYFRRNQYRLGEGVPLARPDDDVDLVIGDLDQMDQLDPRGPEADWVAVRGSLRDHWGAPWPDEEHWRALFQAPAAGAPALGFFALLESSSAKLWRYYWLRKTWTEPGAFPLMILERRAPGR